MLMSQEISKESSLFLIVSCEFSEENLLWLLRPLMATVRDLLLC